MAQQLTISRLSQPDDVRKQSRPWIIDHVSIRIFACGHGANRYDKLCSMYYQGSGLYLQPFDLRTQFDIHFDSNALTRAGFPVEHCKNAPRGQTCSPMLMWMQSSQRQELGLSKQIVNQCKQSSHGRFSAETVSNGFWSQPQTWTIRESEISIGWKAHHIVLVWNDVSLFICEVYVLDPRCFDT